MSPEPLTDAKDLPVPVHEAVAAFENGLRDALGENLVALDRYQGVGAADVSRDDLDAFHDYVARWVRRCEGIGL